MRIHVAALLLTAALVSPAAAAEVDRAAKEISALTAKIDGYIADMEVRNAEPSGEQVARSRIAVSKTLGWRMEEITSGTGHIIVNDYKTSYEYIPEANTIYKFTADHPQIVEDFRRPAEMNFITTLDPRSMKLIGTEQLQGEPVYRFEGTTTTQFMPQGRPVTRRIEAWISKTDGLARKTIEQTEETTGTTIYTNVKVNPQFKPEDFQFTPPANTKLLDINAEMRKQAQGSTQQGQRR